MKKIIACATKTETGETGDDVRIHFTDGHEITRPIGLRFPNEGDTYYLMEREDLVKFLSIWSKSSSTYMSVRRLTMDVNKYMSMIEGKAVAYTEGEVLGSIHYLHSCVPTRQKYGETQVAWRLNDSALVPVACGYANWAGKKRDIERSGSW